MLLIGGSALATFVQHLFDAKAETDDLEKTLQKAVQAADSFGNAESDLGKVIDLTTGKLKTHNLVLLETVKLQQQIKLATAEGEIGKQNPQPKSLNLRAPSAVGGGGLYGIGASGDIDAAVKAGQLQDAQQRGLDAITSALTNAVGNDKLAQADPSKYGQAIGVALATANLQVERLAINGKVAGKNLTDAKLALDKLAVPGMDKSAALQSLKVLAGGPVPDDLKPYEKDKKARTKKPKSTDAVDEFGRDAADRIAAIVGEYDANPTSAALDKTNKQVRALDDLIDDLGRKKPPNFEALIQSAEQAKTVVREGVVAELSKAFDKPKTLAEQASAAFGQIDTVIADLKKNQPPGFEAIIASAEKTKGAIEEGLQRPFADYVKAQADDLAVMQLQAQGREDEATALKEVLALQRSIGPLSEQQKAAILDTVEAMRAEQRQIDINREHTQLYLDALGGIKTVVQDATQAFVRGDLGQLIKTPSKLLDIFSQLKGEQLFQKLFGDDFRDLADQAQGLKPLKQASEAMADALNAVPPQVSKAVESLGDVTKQASAAATALGKVADAPSGATAQGAASGTADGGYAPIGDTNAGTIKDIVVVGNQIPKITRNPEALFESSLGKLSSSIAGLFTNPSNAEAIGKSIGKFSGQALQGAATGTMVAVIGNALGLHLSSGGSQIGGALGSLTGIPGGDIIGSVLGGIVGSLFSHPKSGTASVSSTGGTATTGVSGNDSETKGVASSLADSVEKGVSQIAQQLGGSLGNYDLAIGKFDGKYRVNDNATSASLNYNNFNDSTLHNFGDDEGAAVSYGIQNAIADGAVKGLSPAVQKALASSPDIDKALKDAIGVQNLETLLGGVSGQLAKVFKDAGDLAAQRVDLAKKYGLDLLQVEKVNAEQRADLIASTLKSRVGSLQDLLANLTTGDLSDGSATDKRKALLGQIASAQTDAEAGKDGAADKLSQLFEQLLSTDKDAFGTAGPEYSTDKSNALASVQRVIDIETDRVNAAAGVQKETTAAVQAGNALVDEGNDLLVQSNSKLDAILGALTTGSSKVAANLAAVTQAAR